MHLYLLLISQGPATQALQRYEAYRRSQPVVATEFQVESEGQVLQGRVVRERDQRMFVSMKGAGIDSAVLLTPTRTLELDRTEKTYEENPPTPRAILPASRMTTVFGAFPSWILHEDFRKMLPQGAMFKDAGKVSVAGTECDKVRADVTGQITGSIEAAIDAKGRARDVKVDLRARDGHYAFHWRISKFDMLPKAPANAFSLTIPNGYVPFALDWTYGPLEAGSIFPIAGWRSTKGGTFNLKSQLGERGTLVALLGRDSEPSTRAAAALARIRKDVPLVILTDAKKAVAGTDAFDPSGKLIERINAPATPLFVLLDKTGKITRLWMGYDAATSSAFETAVRDAFAGKD
jgi:hypothetical protein